MMSLTISSNNIHPDINSDLPDESGVVGKGKQLDKQIGYDYE